jgi:hypothetical protein
VTLRALTFALSDLATGRPLGLALICPDARYTSIAWRGAERLDRKFVPTADWKLFEFAVREHLPPTPLEASHVVSRILVPHDRRRSTVVQYLAQQQLDVTSPGDVAQQLDAELRRQTAAAA